MSAAPLPGAPIGPDIPIDANTNQFARIPKLHELLPNGGWPGVVYAQVCVHNVANARDRQIEPANLRPIRGTSYYAISGPRGIVQMALVGTGSPIPGAAPEAGARLFFTDGEVTQLTGHPIANPIWLRPQPTEVPNGQEINVSQGADRSSQGTQSPVGVQTRNPAQRKQPGTEGNQP